MKNKVYLDIVRFLYCNREEGYMISEHIASYLGISKRTTLTYLGEIKKDAAVGGFELVTKQGYGNKLIIKDHDRFNVWYTEIFEDENITEVQKRRMMIFYILITANNYVDIYDLADELHVSVSTIRKDIKSLRPLISKYDLTLKHSRSNGYVIVGEEKGVRAAIAKECTPYINFDREEEDEEERAKAIDHLKQVIEKKAIDNDISISADAISTLVIHILIAINRIETNNNIKIDPVQNEDRNSKEYRLAKGVNEEIEKVFGISLPKDELDFLYHHIRTNNRYPEEGVSADLDDPEVIVFYNTFLRAIMDQTNNNFFNDDDLKNNLLNHISLFLYRLKNDAQIARSKLTMIKDAFPYANELTVIGLIPIEKKYGKLITEEEKLYFAVHLELSLETNSDVKKYNIAIVLDDAFTIFKLISREIRQHLQDRINLIKLFHFDEVDDKELEEYDIIVNASGKKLPIQKPMITINEYIYDSDIELLAMIMDRLDDQSNIEEYFAKDLYFTSDAQSKEEVIAFVSDKVAEKFGIDADAFYESVIQRENYCSTAYSKKIAIPHPLESDKYPNFVAVVRLERPILWDSDDLVQIVFLFSLHGPEKSIRSFYKELTRVIQSSDKAYQLQRTETYEDFIDVFYRRII